MNNAPIEVIKSSCGFKIDRLYFVISDKPPKDIPKAFYFNIDDDLVYDGFYDDFGPLNICKVWKYTTEINKILTDGGHKDHIFYHQTSSNFKKSSNAALLICAFSMIILKKTAEQSYEPFKKLEFEPFRDASRGICTYKCTILDCLRGLQYAMKLGWFNFKTFDSALYEHYQSIENGDINMIVPNKFYAFSSPYSEKEDEYGNTYSTPKDYIPLFNKLGITTVVRLNTKTYDAAQFLENGIKHIDLYFPDGTSPPPNIVHEFLQKTQTDQVFAVHCKAGLGRTGTLIALYAIKHYGFNAADFIGWIRLCRPGSILGPQQQFLLEMEKQLKLKGKQSKVRKQTEEKIGVEEMQKYMKHLSVKDKYISEQEKKINLKGDIGQGQSLVEKKRALKQGK